MVNERRDYEDNFLYYPEVFAAALSRVEPDTSVLGWLGQARALACWCELLRLDPLETCVEWSARGVNAGKGDRAMLASALRDLDDLDRLAAAGAFLPGASLFVSPPRTSWLLVRRIWLHYGNVRLLLRRS